MKVLLAMSGGVDSSVAGALLLAEGHDVVGVTMKLWGGDSDTGCCSVSDVDDARRVAQQLDIDHLVFNFGDDFDRHVVEPYVDDHRVGVTPNPCIECNRRVKFDRLLHRAEQLGFDTLWLPNIFSWDAITLAALIGRETERIELGTAVVPTYPRHPMAIAQQALNQIVTELLSQATALLAAGELDAVRALSVSMLRDGGQSMMIQP